MRTDGIPSLPALRLGELADVRPVIVIETGETAVNHTIKSSAAAADLF